MKHNELRWHWDRNSKAFEPCQPGRACIRVRDLRKPGPANISDPPKDLKDTGAVALRKPQGFGNQPCPGPTASDPIGAGMWDSVPLSLMTILILMLISALVRSF